MKKRFKTAFILGAGLGTRLLPLTRDIPKPLLPLNGRPIITYAMDHLIGAGIERFIVNTHHLADRYDEMFPGRQWRGIPIQFMHEPILLDTGGGIKNIEDLLTDDSAILCYNGDIYSDIALEKLIAAHQATGADATLALRTKGHLLNVDIDDLGDITDMRGALNRPGSLRCLFTGIYAIETSVVQYIEKNKVESIVDTFLRMIAEHPGSVRGIILDEDTWDDIGSPETYASINIRMNP
ncbi:MAG: sugar phosphate nucleotidyltransferase [Syntrophorhabdus sp.]